MRLTRLVALSASVLVAVAVPAQAQKFDYDGTMNGAEVVPGPGDPDGAGNFKISIDSATNTMCYDLVWQGIDAPDASHVHIGATNQAGQIRVDMNLPANGPKACIPVDSASVGHMTGGPKTHYVDLHNGSYADGAVRGQLQR